MRRLFVHEDIFEACIERLKTSFDNLVIGDPNDPSTQLGPLISENSYKEMQASLSNAKDAGAVRCLRQSPQDDERQRPGAAAELEVSHFTLRSFFLFFTFCHFLVPPQAVIDA